MVPRRHGAAHAVLRADRPELVKRRGALDRRLVDALLGHDLVGTAVAGDVALDLGLGVVRRVVVAVRLNDVVLDQRAGGPAVDGQIPVAFGEECARVDDLSGGGLACNR